MSVATLRSALVQVACALSLGFGVWGPAEAQYVEYIHTDALGSPVATTDANRVVLEHSDYESYGKVLNHPSRGEPNYAGHVSDSATGLTYMQQRYYDPQIGRFLSVDPVTADGTSGANFNSYWYANNNPYRFTDPDGRLSWDDAKKTFSKVSNAVSNFAKSPLGKESIFAASVGVYAVGVNGSNFQADVRDVEVAETSAAISAEAASATAAAKGAAASETIVQVNPKNLIPTQTKAEMSGSQIKRLANNMRQNGYDQSKPVDAAPNERGRLEIQDGHHRVEAAKQARIPKIPVRIFSSESNQ
jgi:RHS repeat-associated protein